MARCRDVIIRHSSPAQEAAATAALLQVAHGFSPHIENTAPGLVTLDLRGLGELTDSQETSAEPDVPMEARRYATYWNWAQRLRASVASLNLTGRIGIGLTPNIARHAARWCQAESSLEQPREDSGPVEDAASVQIVAHTPDFIAGLPVAALDPSTDVADILRKWGIRTVGQFLALGQDAMMDRLGLEAIALFAAASTRTTRPLHLVRPLEHYEESFDFEHEVETLEPLLFILNRFVTQLSRRLEMGGLAAGMLRLQLRLESGQVLERTLRVPQPTRRADILLRMLETHLETVRTESPIVGVALLADPTRVEQRQFSLFEAALRDPHQFQETLARLSALVGADRVGTPVRENSHRPDAFQLVPPDFENAPSVLQPRKAELLRQAATRRLRPPVPATVETNAEQMQRDERVCGDQPDTRHPLASTRIVDLLGPLFGFGTARPKDEPLKTLPDIPPREEPVSVETESLPAANSSASPLSLHCSVARGSIFIALGPWRTSGQWWEPGSWHRDEWDVQTQDGQALRLVQTKGEWRVEAIVD
jgi:protein ImuB